MTDKLFKEIHCSLGGLISERGLGRIGLPHIQRPFVWANARMRDLFDLAHRGDLKGNGGRALGISTRLPTTRWSRGPTALQSRTPHPASIGLSTWGASAPTPW